MPRQAYGGVSGVLVVQPVHPSSQNVLDPEIRPRGDTLRMLDARVLRVRMIRLRVRMAALLFMPPTLSTASAFVSATSQLSSSSSQQLSSVSSSLSSATSSPASLVARSTNGSLTATVEDAAVAMQQQLTHLADC